MIRLINCYFSQPWLWLFFFEFMYIFSWLLSSVFSTSAMDCLERLFLELNYLKYS